MAADAAPDPEAKAAFNRLTEAAMKLMDAGENDVYSQNKARRERGREGAAALPRSAPAGLAGAGRVGGGRRADTRQTRPPCRLPASRAPGAAPNLPFPAPFAALLRCCYRPPQEYFERAAAVYIDLPGPSKGVLAGGAGKAAYEEAGEAARARAFSWGGARRAALLPLLPLLLGLLGLCPPRPPLLSLSAFIRPNNR